ncbi:hypothetical protein J437_LFUL002768 [Ladona fulva]|uniref:RNA helicase n=1 Tax=Ladona fulva TaxID=123851 RepID=A0A8K0NUE4_LADFU|nr:hypothetical protein J437_LFUL002768 [Ladona fulva]
MESKYKIGGSSLTNGFKAEKRHSTPDNEVLLKKFRSGSESPSSKAYTSQNLSKQRKALPVYAVKNKLLEEINKHSTLIIIGETGCGKTTQIPQYIREARLAKKGSVAITQPRRVAAVSVATRVSKEMGCQLGETVGYAVRFEDVTSSQTALKYMTDGMLLREALADNLLMSYSIVILDEAHERTIHTDVLFGIVKQAQSIRKAKMFTPLKIILMSATMDVDQFSSYFDDAPIVYLEGRQHHVDIYSTLEPQDDYTFSILVTIFQIHRKAPAKSIKQIFHYTWKLSVEYVLNLFCLAVLFLCSTFPVQTEKFDVYYLLCVKEAQGMGPMLKVHPLFANMASNHQMEVLRPGAPNTRKLILATNVAETSLTIPGVKYVIDSGMVKQR